MPTTIGSGLGSALGIAAETTYNTFVAPTHWIEYESENLEREPKRSQNTGLANGLLVQRGSQRVETTSKVAGTVKTPVYQKGMGLLFASATGTAPNAVQQATTGAYLQTYQLANQAGQSLSVQVLRPTTDGTQHPYSYSGVKVTQLDLECGVDEKAVLTATLLGSTVSEQPAAGTPTYVTPNPEFHFAQGAIKVGTFGAETGVLSVRKAKVTVKRNLDERYYLGASGAMAEPIETNFTEVTGTLDTDFVDKTTFADVFASDAPLSLILTFTGPQIAPTYNYSLTVAIPQIRLNGKPPTVGGPGLIQPSFDFDGLGDDTNPPITITYMSSDTTA